MTPDRFDAAPAGEYAAVRAMRGAPTDRESGASVREPLPGTPERRPPASTGSAGSRPPVPWWVPRLPPQHGAWAFLAVPVLVGFAVGGAPPAGWLLLATWLCAYPVGYFSGRALSARVRRGSWTRLARRETARAIPWVVLCAGFGIPLVLTRPWLLLCALGLGLLWAVGLVVAAQRGERSMANDLLLVLQAVAAVPLTVAVVSGPAALAGALAGDTLSATVLVAAYLTGSVLHVKSLLREAGRRGFRVGSIAWHVAALGLAVLVSPWWAIGFAPALGRAVALRPGLRPGVIGAVELVVAVLVVIAAFVALPTG